VRNRDFNRDFFFFISYFFFSSFSPSCLVFSHSYYSTRLGTTVAFDFAIPSDHPPGTYWYHPHFHGSSGLQVRNGRVCELVFTFPCHVIGFFIFPFVSSHFQVEGGLAGALIVNDHADHGLGRVGEVLVVLQHVGLGSNTSRFSYTLLAQRVGYNVAPNVRNFGGVENYVLVNGLYNPLLDLYAGETKRVRLINAGGA
jgi:FtsP/CotA-like multicopper oxidase with cupredoxin domain